MFMNKTFRFIIGVVVIQISYAGLFLTWKEVDWQLLGGILLGYCFGFGYGISKFMED